MELLRRVSQGRLAEVFGPLALPLDHTARVLDFGAGPLTFAHNTPSLFTFWITKWSRLREIAEFGSTWISGCANHDTLRRGSQVDPDERIDFFGIKQTLGFVDSDVRF